ncbi:MAG: transposase [Sporomusa sp.]|nr:transposase [Sporomusa sp.]
MPRTARKKSNSGIYHIMLRGINRQTIFEDDEDRIKFIDTIRQYKQK